MGTPVKVVIPYMGDSIEEGEITRWLVNVGDVVERDQPLFEMSTDKVDAEIPSPATGVLSRVLYPEGITVPVNAVVVLITDRFEPDVGQNLAESIPLEPRRSTHSSSSAVNRQQAVGYRGYQVISVVLAFFVVGFSVFYLKRWMPSYAASGIGSFAAWLIIYPAISSRNHSLGRWILWGIFFSAFYAMAQYFSDQS